MISEQLSTLKGFAADLNPRDLTNEQIETLDQQLKELIEVATLALEGIALEVIFSHDRRFDPVRPIDQPVSHLGKPDRPVD